MSNDRIPRQAYLMLTNLDEQGKVNWASKTKEILYSAGFGLVWEEQGIGNEREFLNIFKKRLIDMLRQKWTAKLRGSDRYKVYRTFKFYFVSENCWSCIRIRQFRDALVQFRLGGSEIWTHKHRYYKVGQSRLTRTVHFV